jgi:hypothetical protein
VSAFAQEDAFDMQPMVAGDSDEDMSEAGVSIGVNDPAVAEVTQGFDECLRCGNSAQDGGEHGVDGKYMCTACIYKAPLLLGDYAWVQNKTYSPDEPPAVTNPPGFVVQIIGVKKRQHTAAKKYRTHWCVQTSVGATEIRPLAADGEGTLHRTWVICHYVRNDLRLVRVDDTKHIISPVPLVQAP